MKKKKKNQKKNNDNKKILLTLAIVALIIVLIGGATFAYWSWQSNTAQKTNISVTVLGGELKIVGNNISHTSMYPTTDCDGNAALIGETVTVTAKNDTESPMQAALKIRATLTAKQGTLNTTNKGKLNWSIIEVASATTTPANNACSTNSIANGTLASVTSNTDINTGITFIASPLTTTTKYYKLYIWLDSSYEYKNEGNTVSDPMQELQISVKWSPASTLNQQY